MNGSKIYADSVVVATNVPVNTLVRMHTKLAAYRSYVAAYMIPKDRFPNALLWDTAAPYHYERKKAGVDNDTLIVGGEDHRTGQEPPQDPYLALDTWTRLRFPELGARVGHWSGQIIESVDRLAYIGSLGGRLSEVYVATGDSGNGMTYGPLAGMLLRDLITQRENVWAQVYDPNRLRLKSVPRFISENTNSLAQYADWITPAEASTLDSIAPGEGAILREGTHKIAAYRDHHGHMHLKSAVCTHLDGLVRWNGQEKTWDCPCHGSRFSGTGEVINGPAVQNLDDAGVLIAADQPETVESIPNILPPLAF
jgi:nitrite reductase/ring-hydroxylating ferredoxin subunit